ncbi:unnamed protein product [Linum trigynum]|uniref:Uncharacterized protein n=1 Tax=Linum trigynum TaxID=586398 RepID=A0AAV2CPV0_9ROSI
MRSLMSMVNLFYKFRGLYYVLLYLYRQSHGLGAGDAILGNPLFFSLISYGQILNSIDTASQPKWCRVAYQAAIAIPQLAN